MNRDERALYVISVAAELAGVHQQTLRIYERKGLIEPKRTTGGSRRYSDADIALLRRIQELTNEGVTLAGVHRILDLEDKLAQAQQRIRELQERVDQLMREMDQRVEAAHREHRRELVPLRSAAIVQFRSDRK